MLQRAQRAAFRAIARVTAEQVDAASASVLAGRSSRSILCTAPGTASAVRYEAYRQRSNDLRYWFHGAGVSIELGIYPSRWGARIETS